MNHECIQLTDISDEILLLILNKLSNIEVLYSLIGINLRFDRIVSDPIFTNHLTLLKRSSNGVIKLLDDRTFDCVYSQILPKIHRKIKWLDLESLSMERVLLSIDYPNLYGLSLFNIERELAVRVFDGKHSLISIDVTVELWSIYETESHSICS
jgi:hypothetical protein